MKDFFGNFYAMKLNKNFYGSNDNKIFYVNKDVCLISKHLKTALEGGLKDKTDEYNDAAASAQVDGETDTGIHLDINAEILETCIKFMHYKLINREISTERPDFDIDPEIALQVLEAAIYLKC